MPAVSIARLRDELEILYAAPRRQPSTLRQVRQVLRELAEVPGLKTTAHLTTVNIARWMDLRPGRSAPTHKSHLRCLSAIASYCVAEGYLRRDPFDFRGVSEWIRDDAVPSRPRTHRHRSLGEVAAVLERADAEAGSGAWEARRLQALVYVYAYLGLRAAEALHLWVSDVDLDRSVVTLRPHPEDGWRPKTLRSAAELPIAAVLRDQLALWLPHTGCRWAFPGTKLRGPWLSGGPGVRPLDKVRALGERAGVPGLTISTFRKTIGTYAKALGFSQLELKALLRHSNVETQRWYDEDAVESLRQATSRIQFPRTATAP